MKSVRENKGSVERSWKMRTALLGLMAMLVCSLVSTAAASSWTAVNVSPALPPGVNMEGIQVGSTQAWSRDSAGNAYQYVSSTNALTKVSSTTFVDELAVGVGESVFALDPSDNVYQYDFTKVKGKPIGFKIISGATLTTIGDGAEGVWGVDNATGAVYVFNGTGFQPPPNGEPSVFFETISVGDYGIGPWCLDKNGDAYLYNTNTQFFDKTNGVLSSIAVGNGEVWGITSEQTVWTYDPSIQSWTEPDTSAQLVEISVGSDSNVWGVDSLGQVYKFNPKPKVNRFQLVSPQPPETALLVRAGSGGAIYVFATTGNVYKFK
jgi:virginiamycin B lyase